MSKTASDPKPLRAPPSSVPPEFPIRLSLDAGSTQRIPARQYFPYNYDFILFQFAIQNLKQKYCQARTRGEACGDTDRPMFLTQTVWSGTVALRRDLRRRARSVAAERGSSAQSTAASGSPKSQRTRFRSVTPGARARVDQAKSSSASKREHARSARLMASQTSRPRSLPLLPTRGPRTVSGDVAAAATTTWRLWHERTKEDHCVSMSSM